jgi:cytochrome oxidase Cu insertion factor (SCO1/SenC/PrrC family)
MHVRWVVWSAALVVGIGTGVGIAAARQTSSETTPTMPMSRPVANPRLDRGTPVNVVAPAFTLTDQFGKSASLSSFRGKVAVVSFNDPKCTTICPLTTTALLEAKKLLGPSAAKVQLVGIGANPEATQVKWVRAYSQAHGMMRKWRFLTGSLPRMQRVWQSYGVAAAVMQGTVDHTPATFIVNPNGRETRLFLTQMSYSSVPQLAVVLARAIAADLPGHPKVQSMTSLAPIKLIGPRQRATLPLPASHGGSVRLGPGTGPQLLLFFNTWEREVSDLTAHLLALNRYASINYDYAPGGIGVPLLVAIDEANVEPSSNALPDFLRRIPALSYPIAVDTSGRVADGYGVQDSPWLTLVSGSGKILWSYDIATKGWPSTAWLVSRVRAALAHARG